MDILKIAQMRKATKAYDPNYQINENQLTNIKMLLRLAPSSTNSQPWQFYIAQTQEGKARIAESCVQYPANESLINSAALTIVFCVKNQMDEEYLQSIVEQEKRDGRYRNDTSVAERSLASKQLFWQIHKTQLQDEAGWLERQVYLNLGQFLLGVAAMGIDATPIEGFDKNILNENLNLSKKSLTSCVLVSLGRAASDDINQSLPKSRRPIEEIITVI